MKQGTPLGKQDERQVLEVKKAGLSIQIKKTLCMFYPSHYKYQFYLGAGGAGWLVNRYVIWWARTKVIFTRIQPPVEDN